MATKRQVTNPTLNVRWKVTSNPPPFMFWKSPAMKLEVFSETQNKYVDVPVVGE